jgi:DNA-binding transcriptional ArsR family regulator
MKEVKEVKQLTSKNDFYFTIFNLLKENKTPSQISKELKLSKQKISYYLRRFKEWGIVEKKGYGVWELKRSKTIDLEHAIKWSDKKIRGHAFIWKVKTKQFNWIELLKSYKINYSLVRGYTPRIFINNFKVWLGKDSIIIYDNRSFYGKNAIQSRKYAVHGLKSVLEALQKQLHINLGKYLFKPTREHYSMIKNELARQYNDKGDKLIIKDDLDGEWLWIDDSESLNELETGGKGITKDRAGLNLNVQNWYNDMKKTNFEVTPTFLIEAIKGITANQIYMDRNTVKHFEVLENLNKAINELREELKKK